MKIKKLYSLVLTVIIFVSCQSTDSIQVNNSNAEFNIPSFIKSEILRLEKLNPTITKSVSNNKTEETQKVKISNWNNEFAQFLNFDINKIGSSNFTKETKNDSVTFISNVNNKEDVKIQLIYAQGKLIELDIHRKSKNLLFSNEEHLNYTLDKHYLISKNQKVKGLGDNEYIIKGVF